MTPSITCPRCGKVSYSPKDIEHKYCGACHTFHEDMKPGEWTPFRLGFTGHYNGQLMRNIMMQVEGIEHCEENREAIADLLAKMADIVRNAKGDLIPIPNGPLQ